MRIFSTLLICITTIFIACSTNARSSNEKLTRYTKQLISIVEDGFKNGLERNEIKRRIDVRLSEIGAELYNIRVKSKRNISTVEEDDDEPSVSFGGGGNEKGNGDNEQKSYEEEVHILTEEEICIWHEYEGEGIFEVYSSYCKGSVNDQVVYGYYDETTQRSNIINSRWSNLEIMNDDEILKGSFSNFKSLSEERGKIISDIMKKISDKEEMYSYSELKNRFNLDELNGKFKLEDLRNGGINTHSKLNEIGDFIGRYEFDLSRLKGVENRITVARRDLNNVLRRYDGSAYEFMPIDCGKIEKGDAQDQTPKTQKNMIREEVIKKAILNAGGPPFTELDGCGCPQLNEQQVKANQVEVVEVGRKQEGGPSDSGYWPVRARVQGKCKRQERAGWDCTWVDFSSGRVEYIVWKNPYGEWEARFKRN